VAFSRDAQMGRELVQKLALGGFVQPLRRFAPLRAADGRVLEGRLPDAPSLANHDWRHT
jgi:hypothetical protein